MKNSFRIVLLIACSCLMAAGLYAKSVYIIGNRYGVPLFPLF